MRNEFDRLYARESEQCLLGALMIDPSTIEHTGALKPEHFFNDAHKAVYSTITKMLGLGYSVDVVTVSESLADAGMGESTGGINYLSEIAANTPGTFGVKRYAETIIGKALERQLLAASEIVREAAVGIGSTKEKLEIAQSAVMSITESVQPKAPRIVKDVLRDTVETLDLRSQGGIKCFPTGFKKLDECLSGGLRPGNLCIIAGRPGMGKTSIATNMAISTARNGDSSLILSMEMSDEELMDRLLAQVGSVPLDQVLKGNMEGEMGDRIVHAASVMQDWKLFIDDQGGLSYHSVSTKARSVKRKKGLSLLVIDYLQLMTGDGDNRNSQIESITRNLKALAKELQIPIICLSQLSRKCEERTNKRPLASDLRESGAIEQDADVILMVYRDEVYNQTSPDRGTAEIGIVKNRQGSTGIVRLAYQGQYTRFNDLADGWMPEAVEQKRKIRDW